MMLFEIDSSTTYEKSVFGRLEESICEYMEEDMIDKLVPHFKAALCAELNRRRSAVSDVEQIVNTLFPGKSCETSN